MKNKGFLSLILLGFYLSLNASMVSAISGPNISEDEYVSKERGIIVSLDVDGDGIIDSEDKDLTTKPCEQDENCCQEPKVVDTDKDGVLDNKDQCPNTPAGFEVDETGCTKMVNLNVLFDTDKYSIREDSTSQIDKLVVYLQEHKKYSITIQGYTDSDGSDAHNMELSKNRALAVVDYIAQKGIEKNRIAVQWFGESKPLNDNATPEEKQQNRRVIAVIEK